LKKDLRENPLPMRLIRDSRIRRVQDKTPQDADRAKKKP
jgi:hypothetical protein